MSAAHSHPPACYDTRRHAADTGPWPLDRGGAVVLSDTSASSTISTPTSAAFRTTLPTNPRVHCSRPGRSIGRRFPNFANYRLRLLPD